MTWKKLLRCRNYISVLLWDPLPKSWCLWALSKGIRKFWLQILLGPTNIVSGLIDTFPMNLGTFPVEFHNLRRSWGLGDGCGGEGGREPWERQLGGGSKTPSGPPTGNPNFTSAKRQTKLTIPITFCGLFGDQLARRLVSASHQIG